LTGLSTGVISSAIDRLERADTVRRDRNPADRRSVLVTSTPAATARIAAAYTNWINALDTALHHHNRTELADRRLPHRQRWPARPSGPLMDDVHAPGSALRSPPGG
jgi:DNA-binding MarR family transcriptional regulator